MRVEERFVQVSVGPARSQVQLGSGYRLSDAVVLTARHILHNAANSEEIAIRSARGDEWLQAGLVWPADRAQLSEAPDIAVLHIAGESLERNTTRQAIGHSVSDDATQWSRRVHAVGFPKFKSSPRDTHQIEGALQLFSGLRAGALELTDANLGTGNAGARSAADDWAGFSGSPVFANDQIAGVIAAVQRGGRFDFRATRIAPLLSDRTFLSALPKGITIAGQAPKVQTEVRLTSAQRLKLAELLLGANAIKDGSQRDVIVSLLPENITRAITRGGSPQADVLNLLATCEEMVGGMPALFSILADYARGSGPVAEAIAFYSKATSGREAEE